MAWDDAPPPVDSPTPSASWDATPPTPEEMPKSLAGLGKNAIEDAQGVVKGFAPMVPFMNPMNFIEKTPDAIHLAENMGKGVVEEGKRIGVGELLDGHPLDAVKKLGNAAYDKPVSTALDLAPVLGSAGEALGVGGEAAEVAGKAAPAAEAAESIAKEGAGAPKVEPSAPQSSLTDTLTNQALSKAKEVKDYISKGYEGYAKKPGSATEIADYVQEKSQMMAAQQMGFTPLQNRQLGATPTEQMNNIRAIGQYGLDSGIVSPTTGLKGMIKLNQDLLEKSGQTINSLRKEADSLRDPLEFPIDPLQEIRARLDPVFKRGVRSAETGAYQKALETVEDAPATFEGLAKAASKLNHAANEANRLNQPHGAFTDVANVISHVENDRIRQILGPEKAAAYDEALKNFGINKKISEALRRKVGGEVKRLGPGSLTSNLAQKMMDEFGYRAGAKVANKLSGAITRNPSVVRSLPSVFKEFLNQVDETNKEVSGMSSGGVVPDDVRRYVGC